MYSIKKITVTNNIFKILLLLSVSFLTSWVFQSYSWLGRTSKSKPLGFPKQVFMGGIPFSSANQYTHHTVCLIESYLTTTINKTGECH